MELCKIMALNVGEGALIALWVKCQPADLVVSSGSSLIPRDGNLCTCNRGSIAHC